MLILDGCVNPERSEGLRITKIIPAISDDNF